MHTVAAHRSGRCISAGYLGLSVELEWECSKKHTWRARPHSVIYDTTWCKECYAESRGSILRFTHEEADKKAQKYGYTLLGEGFLGVDGLHLFKHDLCGQITECTLHNITKRGGNPCKFCNGKSKLTEECARDYAKSCGGILVSWGGRAIINTVWKCEFNHEFQQSWSYMMNNQSWCGRCTSRFTPSEDQRDLRTRASKALREYRQYDKRKGFVCDLVLEDLITAKTSPCFYCDRMATGLDRKSSDLGHTKDNCVPACIRCNWVKGNHLSFEVMTKVGSLLKEIDP